jgi:hypothetical protein
LPDIYLIQAKHDTFSNSKTVGKCVFPSKVIGEVAVESFQIDSFCRLPKTRLEPENGRVNPKILGVNPKTDSQLSKTFETSFGKTFQSRSFTKKTLHPSNGRTGLAQFGSGNQGPVEVALLAGLKIFHK